MTDKTTSLKATLHDTTKTPLRVDDFVKRNDTPGNVGICFSGGGSRSMAASAGQLRALKHLGMLERTKAISSVSGGTWATAPFTYLPQERKDDDLLGQWVANPFELVFVENGPVSPTNVATVDSQALTAAPTRISLSDLISMFPGAWARAVPGISLHDLWMGLITARILEQTIGLPFNISSGYVCPSLLFWNEKNRNDFYELQKDYISVITANMKAGLTEFSAPVEISFDVRILLKSIFDESQPPPPDKLPAFVAEFSDAPDRTRRPFHIINTAMAVQLNNSSGWYLAPVQITPFFSGIIGEPPAKTKNGKVLVGGGSVTTAAFNGSLTSRNGDQLTIAQSRPFSIADATAASSAVYAETELNSSIVPSNYLPQVQYWAPRGKKTKDAGAAELLTDAGSLDNTGVAALLAYEDIDNIIAFVNANEGITMDTGTKTVRINEDIPALFGLQRFENLVIDTDLTIDPMEPIYVQDEPYLPFVNTPLNKIPNPADLFDQQRFNRVFDRSRFPELLNGLWEASQQEGTGQAAVFLQHGLEIQANDWWAIRDKQRDGKPRKVNVLWVYLNRSKQWLNSLRPQVSVALESGHGPFPNYDTMKDVNLRPAQSNGLAHYTSWVVAKNASAFYEMYGLTTPVKKCVAINSITTTWNRDNKALVPTIFALGLDHKVYCARLANSTRAVKWNQIPMPAIEAIDIAAGFSPQGNPVVFVVTPYGSLVAYELHNGSWHSEKVMEATNFTNVCAQTFETLNEQTGQVEFTLHAVAFQRAGDNAEEYVWHPKYFQWNGLGQSTELHVIPKIWFVDRPEANFALEETSKGVFTPVIHFCLNVKLVVAWGSPTFFAWSDKDSTAGAKNTSVSFWSTNNPYFQRAGDFGHASVATPTGKMMMLTSVEDPWTATPFLKPFKDFTMAYSNKNTDSKTWAGSKWQPGSVWKPVVASGYRFLGFAATEGNAPGNKPPTSFYSSVRNDLCVEATQFDKENVISADDDEWNNKLLIWATWNVNAKKPGKRQVAAFDQIKPKGSDGLDAGTFYAHNDYDEPKEKVYALKKDRSASEYSVGALVRVKNDGTTVSLETDTQTAKNSPLQILHQSATPELYAATRAYGIFAIMKNDNQIYQLNEDGQWICLTEKNRNKIKYVEIATSNTANSRAEIFALTSEGQLHYSSAKRFGNWEPLKVVEKDIALHSLSVTRGATGTSFAFAIDEDHTVYRFHKEGAKDPWVRRKVHITTIE